MVCNDCIHKYVCDVIEYSEPSFAEKCRDFTVEKTGHWIDTGSDSFEYHRVYKCSECGNTEIQYPVLIYRHFRYCPICGAKMERENHSK